MMRRRECRSMAVFDEPSRYSAAHVGGEVPAHDEVGGQAEGEDAVDPVGEEEEEDDEEHPWFCCFCGEG